MSPLLLSFVLCAAAEQFTAIEVRFAPADGVKLTEPVVVLLTGADGVVTRVPLHDDGVIPDESAGDGLYCGGNWFSADSAQGSLTVGSRTWTGGTVTFPAGSELRILSVSTEGDKLIMTPTQPGVPEGGRPGGASDKPLLGDGGQPPGGPDGQLPMGEGGKPPLGPDGMPLGGDPGGRAGPEGQRAPTLPTKSTEGAATWQNTSVRPSFRNSSSTSGVIMIVVALTGLLALAGAAGTVWMRRGGAGTARMQKWFGAGGLPAGGLVPEPEPGLVGDATPSLSDGLSVWVVSPADAELLIAPLLGTLARRRRVLVVAPAQRAIPRVHGGPVYSAPALRPKQVREAVDSLMAESSGKVTLLVLDPVPGALAELAAALPEGMGGVAVCTSEEGLPGLPRVSCHRDRDLWVVRFKDAEGRLAEGAGGLVAAG